MAREWVVMLALLGAWTVLLAGTAAAAAVTAVPDIKIAEVTNASLRVEWTSSTVGKLFTISLGNINESNEPRSLETKADSDNKCSIEFSDLKPFNKYMLTITTPEKGEAPASVEIMTTPSLEMPEIEEVQEGCAHLTLAALPEDQAKDVEAYLLLIRPLEDAKDYPKAEIKDEILKSKLEALVKPPYYLVYEFTQAELAEGEGGQVKIGSGTAKKDGKYGSLQDPRLTSGGNYRVSFVVIMNFEGKQTLFAEESCQMLVK